MSRVRAATLLVFALAACGESPAPLDNTVTEIQVGRALSTHDARPNPPVEAPARGADGSWRFAPTTAETPAGTWHAFDRAGTDGIFDIVLIAPDGTERIAAERPTHQASASLAAGPDGRLWLAFEEGGENWGRGGPLRRSRHIVFGEVVGDGSFIEQSTPTWLTSDEPPTANEAEAPELAVDGAGRPWLFVRTKKTWQPLGKEGVDGIAANRRVAWSIQASVLDAHGWSEPVTLPRSDGPEDGVLELEATALGVRATYFSDGRLARIVKPALTGAWDKPLPGAGSWFELTLALAPSDPPEAAEPSAAPEPREPAANPESNLTGPTTLPTGMRLLWGDLHRHTDASRCKIDEDGDLEDAYRYALGTAGLDFLAVTDHFQHMTPAVFERELATARAFDALPDFVALPGYERALPLGHWTMIARAADNLADAAFAPFRPRFLWDDFDPATWLAIPHQIADRAAPLTWEPSGLDPVIELYQSRRGSYESRAGWLRDLGGDPDVPWAIDYLAAGRIFGVTASSDHATTNGAFTAILIPDDIEPSQSAIFEALRARRCYAATAPIGLDFELIPGDLLPEDPESKRRILMGAEVDAKRLVGGRYSITVSTERLPDPRLRSVELLRGNAASSGEVIESFTSSELDPKSTHALLTLRIGRAKNMRRVTLSSEGKLDFGTPRPLDLEPDDHLTTLDGAPALSTSLDPRDVDGFTVEVDFAADTTLVITTKSGPRETEQRLAFADLLESPSPIFWSLGARTSVRLDPLPHRGMGIVADHPLPDLAPGDWLFVRVITASGDAAWSSPIFVR